MLMFELVDYDKGMDKCGWFNCFLLWVRVDKEFDGINENYWPVRFLKFCYISIRLFLLSLLLELVIGLASNKI